MDKGKKKKNRALAHAIGYLNGFTDGKKNPATPAHSMAEGQVGKHTGNPVDSPYSGNPNDRGFDSSGGRGLAAGHPNLRQSRAPQGTGSLPGVQRSSNEVAFIGQSAFHSAFSGTDSPRGADGGQVRVRLYDAAADAGEYSGMMPVHHALDTPQGGSHLMGDYVQHRNSATSPNGSHSLNNPESHAVPNKASDRLEIMKNTMRRLG